MGSILESLSFSREYLRAAMLVSLLSVWVLVGLFYYLNRYTKRDYFTIWTAAWLFYALWLTLNLRLEGNVPGGIRFCLAQCCVATSSVFLFWGSLRFLDIPVKQMLFGLFMLFVMVWSVIGPKLADGLLQIQLPVFLLIGAGSIFAAASFFHFRKRMPFVGAGMLAAGFLFWGFYLISYPFTQQYESLSSASYFMAAVIQLFIAVSMIVLVLEEVRLKSEQAAAETAAIRASEELFSKAFHASPIPSAVQTLVEQRFVGVNDRFVTLTGCSREELIGHTAGGLFIWEQPELPDQWFKRLNRNEKIQDEATKVRNQSGALRDVLVSLVPVSLGGQPHALLLAQDVSERLLLERQLRQAQKMEGVGQLAAGVAHDFNNILTVIQGHAGLTKNILGDQSPCAKSTEQILRAASRAATLIRQLLMFSRKQVMQFRNLDLNENLTNCLAMIERLMGEHIQLDLRPGSELPAIRADNSMIEQIVMNLAVNARDAMPNGGRVTITTALVPVDRKATPLDPVDRHGQFVCLTFTDTGCGMDTQVLGRIFEPFFTTKAVGKGTGLGLATVFGIVRQHKGWLEVESLPDKGTTFRIYIPTSDQPAEKQDTVCDGELRRGRETVLVAEDEEDLREMVAQLLTVQGYKVLTAHSGRHALEVWERANRSIDLLVTDMVMPEGIMGGELAERLLAKNPRLKVIYTSGYSPGMAGKDFSLTEGRNFLPKPYSIGKLAQFVRECLDAPAVQRN